jgi:hypothetical protein
MREKTKNKFSRSRRRGNKSRGQSLVEFTILLPLLIMMLSGLVEFGFMLNYYLDLIDAARESARFAANDDPLRDAAGVYAEPNFVFYTHAQDVLTQSLDLGSGAQVALDPATDDIVISAFSLMDGAVDQRFPTGWGENGLDLNGNHVSNFSSADITARLVAAAPATGMVLVEVYYDYHMVLALPWITAFVPDTMTLYAYSIMPNVNVEPTPTP